MTDEPVKMTETIAETVTPPPVTSTVIDKPEASKPPFKMKVSHAEAIVRGLTNTQDPEVHIDVQYLIPLIGLDAVEEQLTAFGELQEGSVPSPGSTIRKKEKKTGIGSFNRVALIEALRPSAFLKEHGINLPS